MEYFLFLSDLGRFSLVQAGYLIKGKFSFILRQDNSLCLEAGGWRQGPRPGGRDPDPGAGTRNLLAGTWKPETRVISSWNIFFPTPGEGGGPKDRTRSTPQRGTGVPLSGDPKVGVMPGVWRNLIPEYFIQ